MTRRLVGLVVTVSVLAVGIGCFVVWRLLENRQDLVLAERAVGFDDSAPDLATLVGVEMAEIEIILGLEAAKDRIALFEPPGQFRGVAVIMNDRVIRLFVSSDDPLYRAAVVPAQVEHGGNFVVGGIQYLGPHGRLEAGYIPLTYGFGHFR